MLHFCALLVCKQQKEKKIYIIQYTIVNVKCCTRLTFDKRLCCMFYANEQLRQRQARAFLQFFIFSIFLFLFFCSKTLLLKCFNFAERFRLLLLLFLCYFLYFFESRFFRYHSLKSSFGYYALMPRFFSPFSLPVVFACSRNHSALVGGCFYMRLPHSWRTILLPLSLHLFLLLMSGCLCYLSN